MLYSVTLIKELMMSFCFFYLKKKLILRFSVKLKLTVQMLISLLMLRQSFFIRVIKSLYKLRNTECS